MKTSIIRQLNQINAKFYEITAEEFSKSRSFYWQGWKDLIPHIKKLGKDLPTLKVLDLGCGNGRFGEFLYKKKVHPKIQYHGGDNSDRLLKFADKRLGKEIPHKLFHVDIVKSLLTGNLSGKIPNQKYHLITLFGVLHHIPSKKLRRQLFLELEKHLVNGGLLVFTAWRFLNEKRFDKKQIHPEIIGINPDDLEENDYILDWQRGITANRYCHFTSDEEMKKLVSGTKLNIIDEYIADGKSGNLNAYTILEKKPSPR